MTILLEFWIKKLEFFMPTDKKEKFPHRLPRLAKPKDGSLAKPWYCEYYAWDDTAQALKRKRVVINDATKQLRLDNYAITADIIRELLVDDNCIVNPSKHRKRKATKTDMLVLPAMELFLEFNSKVVKESTIRSYTSHINRLKEYLDFANIVDTKLADFTEDMALDFADWLSTDKRIGNRTRNNNIATMVGVFNHFKSRKFITANPFDDINRLPTVARSHTAFMPHEAALFKENCQADPQLWLFCQFIYYVFVRPREELRHLKVGDISAKSIVINYTKAKNRRTEHIMIPTALEAIIVKEKLREYPKNFYVFGKNGKPGMQPTYYHQFYRRHAKVLLMCGLQNKNIDMYSWKHTGVIALWTATQNMQLLREQCRHADLGSTMKYLRDLGLFTDYDQINKFPEL
jgi:site-specific recombinase XerD